MSESPRFKSPFAASGEKSELPRFKSPLPSSGDRRSSLDSYGLRRPSELPFLPYRKSSAFTDDNGRKSSVASFHGDLVEEQVRRKWKAFWWRALTFTSIFLIGSVIGGLIGYYAIPGHRTTTTTTIISATPTNSSVATVATAVVDLGSESEKLAKQGPGGGNGGAVKAAHVTSSTSSKSSTRASPTSKATSTLATSTSSTSSTSSTTATSSALAAATNDWSSVRFPHNLT